MQSNNGKQYREQWLVEELNISKNSTVSLAIPHKIKIIFSLQFWMNLDVGMYMLPALVRKNTEENIEEKCERVQRCLPG